MSQSLSQVLVHAVWSTKERAPVIDDPHQPALLAYLAGVFRKIDCPVLEANCERDHVHVLFRLARTIAISQVLEKTQSASSAWLKRPPASVNGFQWQGGYATFSVSPSQEAVVRRYIQNQREHHRRQSFQEELRALFRRHRVAFDENYLWD